MNNFFLVLHEKFSNMGMNGKDLDSMLNSLPWKFKEFKNDGTEVWECEVKE